MKNDKMESSAPKKFKVFVLYFLATGLLAASLYASIEISAWFYLLAIPSFGFLALYLWFHTGCNEYFEKRKRAREKKTDEERELIRKRDLMLYLRAVYLADDSHHHFPQLIYDDLVDSKLTEHTYNPYWSGDSEFLEAFHLNALELKWFQEMESFRYVCVDGKFHGQCDQLFSWGKAILNFSEGSLNGKQKVFFDETLILELTYKAGQLWRAEEMGLTNMKVRTTVVGNVFQYSIDIGTDLIQFDTLEGRPELSRRRLQPNGKDLNREDLELWQYSTPIGSIRITRNSVADVVDVEMMHDSAGISRIIGNVSLEMRDKEFWSPLAFLFFDYRYAVGRYGQFELTYLTGNKGPPGASSGRIEYPHQIERFEELFV